MAATNRVEHERMLGVRSFAALLVAQGLTTSLVAWLGVGGTAARLSVPFRFSNDSLVYLAFSKGTFDHGWWAHNPSLGAPSGFDAIAFGQNSYVDQLLVGLVSLFTDDFSVAVNVTWLAMLGLTAASSTLCLVMLGVSRASALAIGMLIGLNPYALYTNLELFSLTHYLVPFPATLAIVVASGRHTRLGRGALVTLVAGCAAIGANYVYFSYFAGFLLVCAAIIALLGGRDVVGMRWAGSGLAALLLTTALSLAPTWLHWETERPIVITEKQPSEADLYGLKLRSLISPVNPNALPPLRRINRLEEQARFGDLETQNARLGLVGSAGLVLALLALLTPPGRSRERPPELNATARLILMALLLGTIGGLGSVVALLLSPHIRAYTRIAAFVAYLAFVAAAFGLEAVRAALRSRFDGPGVAWGHVVVACVLVLGLFDQLQALVRLRDGHASHLAEFGRLEHLTGELEEALPSGAMVYSLPPTIFLNDYGQSRMGPYDHFKPYLASSDRLRWSYPAFSNRQFAFDRALARLSPEDLVGQLHVEGFSAIWLDRSGYDDDARDLQAELRELLGDATELVSDERYSVYDLRSVGSRRPDLVEGRSPLEVALATTTQSMPACAGSTRGHVDAIGGRSGPFGGEPLILSADGDVTLYGWAVLSEQKRCPSRVEVALGEHLFAGFVGFPRPDVERAFNEPGYRLCGFRSRFSMDRLSGGRHHLSVRAVNEREGCYFTIPGAVVQVD